MAEIRILSRTELMIYPTPENPQAVKAVTYQSGFMPPRTVYIPVAEYTPERERETIRHDLERVSTTKPEVIEV